MTITPTQDAPGPCPQGHKTVSTAEWPAHPSTWRWFTRCTCCGWQGPSSETEAGSIAAWNDRPNAYPELVAALKGIATKAQSMADARQDQCGLWQGCADEARTALRKAGVP